MICPALLFNFSRAKTLDFFKNLYYQAKKLCNFGESQLECMLLDLVFLY